MSQAQFAAYASPGDFPYGASQDAAGLKLSLSIFASRAHVRDQLREDAEAAGFRIAEAADLTALRDEEAIPLGEVVLLDCPEADGAVLAALARIDMRAAHAGAALIVSTSILALDDVFGCLDQSGPQILVDPSRAERLIALGQVLARLPGRRVRELSEEDRLLLLRLTEQVNQIAERIERFGGPSQHHEPALHLASGLSGADGSAAVPGGAGGAFRFVPPSGSPQIVAANRLELASSLPLPDPQLVRRMIRQRQMRARFFDGDLFSDPAWDMLLDLTAAQAEHARVSVTSLCIASGVPPTTALRWIGQMVDTGLFQRNEDESDRRRAFITLTDKATAAMAGFFADLGNIAII